MLQIGKFNELIVKKEVDFGVYLVADDQEILLPKKYVPKETKVGDSLRVFIYTDSEDRLIATTLIPKAIVGEFAYLLVKDTNKYGAFLDWGLEKDLLVPHSEQPQKMQKGKGYLVKVYLDPITERVVATGKTEKNLEKEEINLTEGAEVELLVYGFTERGIKVIVDNKYPGLLYKSDVYQELRIGDKAQGYVRKIREDNKIDVSIRKTGPEEIQEAKNRIFSQLKASGGFLSLNDKSSPELIKKILHLSKKSFKKGVGGLYKEGIIEITEEGIKLKEEETVKP